jgi:hypothetical protein
MTMGQRIKFAFRAFFSLLFSGTLASDIADVAAHPPERMPSFSAGAGDAHAEAERRGTEPPNHEAPARPAAIPTAGSAEDGAVQILSLLQRDGRLLDFLMEDVSGYPDAQVGAAVRDVHANCRSTLTHYLDLEPILDGVEDQPVTLPVVDPVEVRLVGRTLASPPVRGVLRHRGWRSARVQLPPLPPAGSRQVLAPAEVEIP